MSFVHVYMEYVHPCSSRTRLLYLGDLEEETVSKRSPQALSALNSGETFDVRWLESVVSPSAFRSRSSSVLSTLRSGWKCWRLMPKLTIAHSHKPIIGRFSNPTSSQLWKVRMESALLVANAKSTRSKKTTITNSVPHMTAAVCSLVPLPLRHCCMLFPEASKTTAFQPRICAQMPETARKV